MHNIFFISQVSNCIGDKSHVVDLSDVEIGTYLVFEKQPIAIMDRRESFEKLHVSPLSFHGIVTR